MNSEPFALRAEYLFDGETFVDDPVVLIDDHRIVAVGADVPDSAVTLDLGSLTLMPGLVDCHQHLVFDGVGTLEEQVTGVSDDALRARAREAARRALLGGVTTVRDLGDRNFVTLDLRNDPNLPTILCAGPPITIVGGHCWYLGGETKPEDLRGAVRERIERECEVVKIMVTGGFLTPATPMWKSQFQLDELELVVREAHEAGVSVAAHCHGLGGIQDAIQAGVDTIEHCTFLNEDMQPSPTDELLESLAQSSTVVSATFGQTPGAQIPESIAKILPAIHSAFGRIHELGGDIVLGSDAGIDTSKLHDVGRFAMTDFIGVGMSPVEALRALTSRGADALGLPHKGRIATGSDADLLAVDGHPGRDPDALTKVVEVWRGGVPMHNQPLG